MQDNKKIFQIPITDFSFKKIFGTEANKRFVIHFLNCFVSRYTGEVKDVTFLPTEHYGMSDIQRRVVFDILCTDQKGRQFIIEMQRANQPEFAERSIFYLSRAISASMKKGSSNYRIIPTYSVNILDFEMTEFSNSDECFRVVQFKDQKNRLLTDKVAIFYLNLCNFAARQNEVTEEMHIWLNLLKNMQKMDDGDYAAQAPFFRELMDECRISNLNTMEKEKYEKSVLEYEDVREAVEYAKKLAAKDAYEEGLSVGMEKGIEKGIEKGRLTALQLTAEKLLNSGFSIDDVVQFTGLSEEQVVEIQKAH